MSGGNLIIVESPTKARTIEKYLTKDFSIECSFGHVRDLPKKGLGVDVNHEFAPSYEVSDDKKKVVADLKKKSKGKVVWLASDDDREGEAIAWHLSQVLGLDPKNTKRVVFHEITKPAFERAVANPRTIDQNLVDAQQARRILDRLVGYKLSPVLWKKVQTGLSAGRVQSVAVRLIVEREREIKVFTAAVTYKVTAGFTNNPVFEAELDRRLETGEIARSFLEGCAGASFNVDSIAQKPGVRNPGAPFTTSTLQQEASRRLGFSVRQTMTLAQRLYEQGHITYMRTDSTNLADQALDGIQTFIINNFGTQYAQRRQYKTKSKSAQEAHEAIRPTSFTRKDAGSDANQKRLYQLIWQRAIASQMAPARIQKTEVIINISGREEKFVAIGETLEFDGFLKVAGGGKDDVLLPKLKQGQKLDAAWIGAAQNFSRPPARYSEAGLVKKLEEMGIGRPSTYAPTISTIQDRGYVEKKDLDPQERQVHSLRLEDGKLTEQTETVNYGGDRSKLLPTYTAEMTTDFLTKYFAEIVDYDFTARTEVELDKVEEGKRAWQKMIGGFYKSFTPLLEKSESVSRTETAKMHQLGEDPKSGKVVIARYGRYGPMLQLGEVEGEVKPHFAPMPAGTTLETVTLEQALQMFELPRTVGQTADGEPILSNIGRFGPYVQVGKSYTSIKGFDPLSITEAEARKLIEEKQKLASSRNIQDFGDIKIIKGPYGPYVTDGKKNAKIEKGQDPAKLTQKEAETLLKSAPAKKRRNFKRKKSTS